MKGQIIMSALRWTVPAVAMAALGACVATSSSVDSKTYNVSGFDSVSARSGVNVILKEGPFSVSAEAPKEKLEKITVEMQGSTLVISQKPTVTWFGWSGRSLVTVVAPSYRKVEASGGADVDGDSLRGEALQLEASGGADIRLGSITATNLSVSASGGADVDADTIKVGVLDVDAGGGADVRLSGSCTSLTVKASGGADFDGDKLTCTDGVVTASGGGDVDVALTGKASGNASSGGDVRIRGNPTSVDTDESSGGDVEVASGS